MKRTTPMKIVEACPTMNPATPDIVADASHSTPAAYRVIRMLVHQPRSDAMWIRVMLLSVLLFPLAGHAQAPARQNPASQKTVWYFYRVKWGFQEEFQTLFARNHLPVLREQIKTGRIVAVKTFVPSYHGDGRADWTFAVQIVFKDEAALSAPSGEEEIQKRLYQDRAKFLKEEQRRFEILDAHWDVPLNELDLR